MSPLSPSRPPPPIMHHSTNSSAAVPTHLPPHSRGQSAVVNERSLIHKRNASLDNSRFTTTNVMSTSLQHHLDNNKLNKAQHTAVQSKKPLQQQHSRHNSYDGMPHTTSAAAPSPQRPTNLKYSHFDQTYDDDYESMPSRDSALPQRQKVASIKQQNSTKQQQQQPQKQHSASPIKRSSSFNTKPHDNPSPARAQLSTPKMHNKFTKAMSAPTSARIQKSASSSCFKDAIRDGNYDDFFINDDDDLNPNNQFTPSDSDDEDNQKFSLTNTNELQPVTNTRFNKTFLMRCEQSKNKVGGGKPHFGVIACPNTPEMPRRDMTTRSSIRERASMPRDSSLNRIYDKKPLSASSTSKIASNTSPNNTAAAAAVTSSGGRVTSKYLDISKYKPEKGNNFLKRNDTKTYVGNEVKKSSSSACLQSFQRDVARASTRSSGGTGSRPSSASTNKKKDG